MPTNPHSLASCGDSTTALAAHAPPVAQHVDAQSASLRHCPVMNCAPLPVPTFAAPAAFGSTVTVPELPLLLLLSLPLLADVAAGAAAAALVDAAGVVAVASSSPNPHPVFPAWKSAARPEQSPMLPKVAQHAVSSAQSFELMHCPPMNWPCAWLPTRPVRAGSGRAGSGAGIAVAVMVKARMAAEVENRTILAVLD